jgi:nucleoid-associated protein YgaU/chemotaxis signal transduction protein
MAAIDDYNALLLYRVGPVRCCSPSQPVLTILPPPAITRPPGSDTLRPGIFKYGQWIVRTLDLREGFGVEQARWKHPGRIIVSEVAQGHCGIWVDDIIEVMETPTSGWGPLPPHLPRGIFSRTLLIDDTIYLYAEFAQLNTLQAGGYLRGYIEQLNAEAPASKAQHAPRASESSRHAAAAPVRSNPSHVSTDAPGKQTSATGNDKTRASGHGTQETHTRPVKQGTKSTASANADKAHPEQDAAANRNDEPSFNPTPRKTNDDRELVAPQSGFEQRPSRETRTSQANADHPPTKHATYAAHADKQRPPTPTHGQPAARQVEQSATHVATRPATAHVPDNNSPNNTGRGLGVALVVLLLILLAPLGGYWWYHMTQSQPQSAGTPSKPPVAETAHSEVPSEPKPETIISGAKPDATAPEPDIPAEPDSSPDDAGSGPGDDESTREDQAVAVTPTQPSANPNDDDEAQSEPDPVETASAPVSSDQPRATIQRDAEGITIVLETDDPAPVFKQPPQAKPALRLTEPTPFTAVPAVAPEPDPRAEPADTPRDETATTPDTKTTPKVTAEQTEIVHIVVKGDTLWAIAERYVNNPFRYPELARLSHIDNPDLIYPGDRVRIIKRVRSHSTSEP